MIKSKFEGQRISVSVTELNPTKAIDLTKSYWLKLKCS